MHPSAPTRNVFALTGKSVALDPLTHAVRGDLADVRLAEYVFAPHYAAPMNCVVCHPVTLLAARGRTSAVLADLAAGEAFEVLELAGGNAWGVAPGRNLVGYVDRHALERAT